MAFISTIAAGFLFMLGLYLSAMLISTLFIILSRTFK
jgi:hypothetical protein